MGLPDVFGLGEAGVGLTYLAVALEFAPVEDIVDFFRPDRTATISEGQRLYLLQIAI